MRTIPTMSGALIGLTEHAHGVGRKGTIDFGHRAAIF